MTEQEIKASMGLFVLSDESFDLLGSNTGLESTSHLHPVLGHTDECSLNKEWILTFRVDMGQLCFGLFGGGFVFAWLFWCLVFCCLASLIWLVSSHPTLRIHSR